MLKWDVFSKSEGVLHIIYGTTILCRPDRFGACNGEINGCVIWKLSGLHQIVDLQPLRQTTEPTPGLQFSIEDSTKNLLWYYYTPSELSTGHSSPPDDQELFVLNADHSLTCQGLVRPCGCWHSTLWELESWSTIRWVSISFVFSFSFSVCFSMSLLPPSHYSAFSGWHVNMQALNFVLLQGGTWLLWSDVVVYKWWNQWMCDMKNV